MATKIITHHGHDFGIDTSDWSDSQSADKAAATLEDWLRGLDAQETALLHADLKAEAETAIVDLARTAGNDAALAAMEDWVSIPDTGHNCDLVAV